MYSTRTATATAAQVRELAANIKTDLTQVRALYDKPTAETVENLSMEFQMLVEHGYLEKIQYGFKRNGLIVFQLEYTSTGGGGTNDRPGRIPATLNLDGASWFSYLTTSRTFDRLSASEKAAFEAKLPLQRTGAEPPSLAYGVYYGNAKSYATDDFGVRRNVCHD